jgi:hypothetical protein
VASGAGETGTVALGATSVSELSPGADSGAGTFVPSGTKATVMSSRSVNRTSAGLPTTSLPSAPGAASGVHVRVSTRPSLPPHFMPFFIVFWPGTLISELETLPFTASMNRPKVASLPEASTDVGCTCTMPSPWVWMPRGSFWSVIGGTNLSQR